MNSIKDFQIDVGSYFHKHEIECLELDNVIVKHSPKDLNIIHNGSRIFKYVNRRFYKNVLNSTENDVEISELCINQQHIDYEIDESCFLLHDDWGTNYAHYIMDTFPKCIYYDILKTRGYDLSIIHAFNDGNVTFVNESLKFFDENCKIKVLDSEKYYNVKKLIIPSCFFMMGHPDQQPIPKIIVDFYRKMSDKIEVSPKYKDKKIYISRQDVYKRNWWHNRQLLNELELIYRLKDKGYEIVELMDLSFTEKIQLFKSAKKILQVCGASMFNMMFSTPNTEFVIICDSGHKNYDMWFKSEAIQMCRLNNLQCNFLHPSVEYIGDAKIGLGNFPWKIVDLNEVLVNI